MYLCEASENFGLSTKLFCNNYKIILSRKIKIYTVTLPVKIYLQVHKNYWSYAQIIFLASFAIQVVLRKDPTIWLDGA
jgi:hypothetical protein